MGCRSETTKNLLFNFMKLIIEIKFTIARISNSI